MQFRYQVLKTLTDLVGNSTLPRFEPNELTMMFPAQSPEIVISCLHELREENLVFFSHNSGNTFYSFSVAPSALAYLLNLKEVKYLKHQEKWIERAYGFVAGVLSAITTSLIVQWLQ